MSLFIAWLDGCCTSLGNLGSRLIQLVVLNSIDSSVPWSLRLTGINAVKLMIGIKRTQNEDNKSETVECKFKPDRRVRAFEE